MTYRTNAITHTQEYTVLPRVVRHTFIFGLFTTPNLCPLTQNPGDATAPTSKPCRRLCLHITQVVTQYSPAYNAFRFLLFTGRSCL